MSDDDTNEMSPLGPFIKDTGAILSLWSDNEKSENQFQSQNFSNHPARNIKDEKIVFKLKL